jgi:hypothetical protein
VHFALEGRKVHIMSRKTRSKISLAIIAAAAFASSGLTLSTANAASPVVQWTFESLTFAGASSVTTASVSGISPEFNPGAITASASASHASTATVFSTPSGNGSNLSLSSNHWGAGDYYEFDINSAGLSNLSLSVDQTGSSTGPRDFQVQYNNGGSWINLTGGAYSLPTAATSTGGTTVVSWSPTATATSTTFTFDLSSISGLTGIRLVDNGTTNITGGTVATGGSGRVDNVTFSGDAAAPEPATAGVVAAGAAFIVARRRRR